MSMSKRKGDIVFAVIAVILVCMAMAFMTGCEDKEAMAHDLHNLHGDVVAMTTESHYDYNHYAEIVGEPKNPYLYKNLENDHWICSKHGDLYEDKDELIVFLPCNLLTVNNTTYCYDCYWEVQVKLLNQHITGVKEK